MADTSERPHGGFHSILEKDHDYIFVDATMQAWPDADYPNAHRHGVTCYGVTAWRPHGTFEENVKDCMDWHGLVRDHPHLSIAESVEDIRNAKARGDATLLIAAQGADWIERDPFRIEAMERLGLRQLLLAYNATNQLADGCLDRTDSGLTKLGRKVVEECVRVGILLDGTHTGKRATLEMIDLSADPTIFSHSNPSAISPNLRNIDDEQIKACTDRDGVICLAPWGPLVMKPNTAHQPTVDDFIDMVDHIANLTGSARHIGIGTDMSLGSYPLEKPGIGVSYGNPFSEYGEKITADPRSPKRNLDGFDDFAEVSNLIERLEARGYETDDVAGILGENYLRVAGAVWNKLRN